MNKHIGVNSRQTNSAALLVEEMHYGPCLSVPGQSRVESIISADRITNPVNKKSTFYGSLPAGSKL